jgi:hypothetical protein
LFEKWRHVHGYEIGDLYAVLAFVQYLETCCSHRCTELVETDEGISISCVCCGTNLGLAKYRVEPE